MANWEKLIQNFFAHSDPDESFARIALAGCDASAITKSESEIGTSLPEELRNFYQHANGIGLGDVPTDSPRFIPPVESLPDFVNSARSSFSETHPKHAARYIPFIEWENGDSTGYFLNDDETLFDYLLIFSHEHYDYNDEQDINEFLTPFAESLQELLSR